MNAQERGAIQFSGKTSLSDISDMSADARTLNTKTTAQMAAQLGVVKTFGITVDGGTQVITSGYKGELMIPYNCTITNWYLVAYSNDNIAFDLLVNGLSLIGTGNGPLLEDATSASAAVAGWDTVTLSEGDVISFNLTSTPALTTRTTLVIKAI